MKTSKIVYLASLLFLFQLNSTLAQSLDSATVISVTTFEKMTSKKRNLILDVRTPEEMAEGYISNASNIDFLDEQFSEQIKDLNKNKTYLLYCRSGKRSAKAGALMKAAGFKKVYSLDGGITEWKEEGKPMIK